MSSSDAKRWLCCAAVFLIGAPGAWANSTTNFSALALAGVVAPHDPLLGALNRHRVARLFDGRSVHAPAGLVIHVTADQATCRASDVDITFRSCELTFGARKRSLSGRAAAEIFATMIEAGVPSNGAAGSIYESVTALDCALDPYVIAQKAGGGATCAFTPGP